MRIASRALTVAAAIAAVALARPAAAQVLYSETFDDGNAASRWTTSPSGNPNYVINYAFDYASAGIPAAPGGTSTTGLKMEVNTAGAAIGSLMAFPNAENFSGNHTLAFDIWFNVTGTTATTEFGIFGLNHTSTAAQTPTGVTPGVGPSPNGIDYAMTGDTGAGRDIRLYVAGVEVNGTAGGYARNNLLIQEEQAAPYNFAYQPYLTSTTPMPANQWLRVAVTAYSGTTLFQVNGQTWARRANTTGTGNIMLGYMDIFTSVAPATIFGLYDNVTVSVADAPATQLAWTPDGTTAGGSGSWSNLGTQWIGSGTAPTTWDWSLPAKFQGTAGTVTIPTQVTAGAGLEFLTDGYTVSSGTLILGSYDPASAVSFNTNAIAQVTVAAGATARIESYIRGTRGVTKLGDGTLVLANANAVSGTSVVQSGTLRLGNQSALAQSPVSVVPGGTLEIDPALGIIAPRLLLNGGTVSAAGATLTVDRDIGVKQFVVNSGQLAGSPALEVTLAGTMVMSGSAINTIDVSTLSVQETGTDGGRIDLGVGRINVAPGGITAEALVADIVAGRGDGSWTGTTGITSSKAASEVAASNLRAVGWIDDGAGALSVAYAAPGDTNIDWVVDILDVSNFVAAGKFGTGDPATWADGDFNYDGLVDIQDVSDFSATGLYGGASYNAPAGSAVAAVPEPAAGAAAGAGLVAAAVLARRHSRRRAA